MSSDRSTPDDRTFPLTGREVAVAGAFWTLLALARVADLVFRERDVRAAAGHLVAPAAESLAWFVAIPLVVLLVERCVARRRPPAAQGAAYAAAGVVLVLGVGALSWWVRGRAQGVGTPPPGFRRPPPPPFWLGVGNALGVYLAVLGAALTRAYLLRERTQREQRVLLEARLAESRLEALRRQLDPHFLFNTLNLVASLVERDPAGARRMIARLSDFLRATLADGDEVEIPLHRELALVDVYLDIMRTRFAGRLVTEARVDPAVRDALVPPLVLQPLVENAVKHGVERARGPVRVAVEASRADGALVLRVRDAGESLGDPSGGGSSGEPARPPAPGAGGVGLRNTQARLDQLYGGRARLTLGAVPGGTEAEVRLPLRAAAGAGDA